jgi:hypothetical protein
MKPDTDEPDYEPHIERMYERADYLRTERKDREWEQSQNRQPLNNFNESSQGQSVKRQVE